MGNEKVKHWFEPTESEIANMNFETMRYEWHLRWEELPEDNVNDDSNSDLHDTGFQSLRLVKARLDRFNKVTDEDIAKGYLLEDVGMDCRTVLRLELAKYDHIDGGYITARVWDKKFDEHFDEKYSVIYNTPSIRVPKRFQKEFARNYEWASIL